MEIDPPNTPFFFPHEKEIMMMCDAYTACGSRPFGFGSHLFGSADFSAVDWRYFMPYELQETKAEYIVIMPLPGFESKEISISIRGAHVLIEAERITGEKPDENSPTDAEPPEVIISWGRPLWDRKKIEVTVPLKEEVDPEKVKAKITRGILSIHFQKKPKTKIPVEE
jgi:HSP20 family molecular chaperone IbpA